jgi:hypothetical protein
VGNKAAMGAEEIVRLILLLVLLVVPFLLMAPSLLEMFFGVDFGKDPNNPNVRMSRGGEAKPVQEAEGSRTREPQAADEEGFQAEGQLERAGSARYPYGSHALVAPGNRTIRYILRSDAVQLREFEGQRVRISASVVEGHPPNEGDPQLLDVFAVTPLRQEEE